MSAKEKRLEVNSDLRGCREEDLSPCGGMDHKVTHIEAAVRRTGSEIK
jgi:hypothetical protein